MFKDEDFYRSLDLPAVALRIPADRASRLRSEALGDILWAVMDRCATEMITQEFIRSLLGEPDRLHQRDCGEAQVWEYDWIGMHGPNEYSSCTPIVFRDGRMVGIERDDEVLTFD